MCESDFCIYYLMFYVLKLICERKRHRKRLSYPRLKYIVTKSNNILALRGWCSVDSKLFLQTNSFRGVECCYVSAKTKQTIDHYDSDVVVCYYETQCVGKGQLDCGLDFRQSLIYISYLTTTPVNSS